MQATDPITTLLLDQTRFLAIDMGRVTRQPAQGTLYKAVMPLPAFCNGELRLESSPIHLHIGEPSLVNTLRLSLFQSPYVLSIAGDLSLVLSEGIIEGRLNDFQDLLNDDLTADIARLQFERPFTALTRIYRGDYEARNTQLDSIIERYTGAFEHANTPLEREDAKLDHLHRRIRELEGRLDVTGNEVKRFKGLYEQAQRELQNPSRNGVRNNDARVSQLETALQEVRMQREGLLRERATLNRQQEEYLTRVTSLEREIIQKNEPLTHYLERLRSIEKAYGDLQMVHYALRLDHTAALLAQTSLEQKVADLGAQVEKLTTLNEILSLQLESGSATVHSLTTYSLTTHSLTAPLSVNSESTSENIIMGPEVPTFVEPPLVTNPTPTATANSSSKLDAIVSAEPTPLSPLSLSSPTLSHSPPRDLLYKLTQSLVAHLVSKGEYTAQEIRVGYDADHSKFVAHDRMLMANNPKERTLMALSENHLARRKQKGPPYFTSVDIGMTALGVTYIKLLNEGFNQFTPRSNFSVNYQYPASLIKFLHLSFGKEKFVDKIQIESYVGWSDELVSEALGQHKLRLTGTGKITLPSLRDLLIKVYPLYRDHHQEMFQEITQSNPHESSIKRTISPPQKTISPQEELLLNLVGKFTKYLVHAGWYEAPDQVLLAPRGAEETHNFPWNTRFNLYDYDETPYLATTQNQLDTDNPRRGILTSYRNNLTRYHEIGPECAGASLSSMPASAVLYFQLMSLGKGPIAKFETIEELFGIKSEDIYQARTIGIIPPDEAKRSILKTDFSQLFNRVFHYFMNHRVELLAQVPPNPTESSS